LQQRVRGTEKQTIGVWGWIKDCAVAGWKKVAGWMGKTFTRAQKVAGVCKDFTTAKLATACRKTKAVMKSGWKRTLLALTMASRMRKTILLALAAGITLGVGCYFSGPVLSSLISGTTGFVSAMATGTWKMLAGLLAGEEIKST
jgi:hypothetical protein